jgi:hypothetical protein
MKRMFFPLLFSLTFFGSFNTSLKAQDQDFKYRRSSLSMILIESDAMPNKEAVMSSWNNYPFPDKYNKHDIETKSFNADKMNLSDAELLEAGFLKDTLNNPLQITKAVAALKPLRYLNAEKSTAVVLPNEKQEYQIKIDKVIKEQKIANNIVATWFNLSADGKINFDLIAERGNYNASEMDINIASTQARGSASIRDAGKELINNSFVTFTKVEFIENEPAARVVRDAAKASAAKSLAGKPQLLIDKAMQAADAVYEKTKEGYSLWSKSWLYQLNWSDEIFNKMSQVYKTEKEKVFDSEDLFKLNFVGVQYNQSLVTFKIGEKRTQEQIIDLALVRNVDNAFAKLQKKNEVFKPKVPVLTSNPITAQIGMKEGLSGGESFDVLEMTMNSKTGLTEYKVIGSATADKKTVWDNRYNAGEEAEPALDKDGNPITATPFKGSKKVQPGMLLKLAK